MAGLKQTFVTKLTDVNSSAQEPLGTIRVENNKVYKYVQILNSATVAGVAGDLVVYFAATGYGNNRVCVRAADGDATTPFGAGALVAAVAGVAATAEYGWIQIEGLCTLSNNVTSAAAGMSFAKTTADKIGALAVATNAAGIGNMMGISVNTTTGVCLNCPW